MKKLHRTLLLVTVVAFSAAIAGFAVGGRMGFVHGYAIGSQGSSVTTGFAMLHLLPHYHGDDADVTKMLESFIDGALMSSWVYEPSPSRPFYAPEVFYQDLTPILRRLANHRAENPHEIPEPGQEMVRQAVARYSQPSAADE